MATKYQFKIKNWKLSLLALIFFCLFLGLGIWQLTRADQKQRLINNYAERTQHSPFTASDLSKIQDWRFYRAQVTGTFDNQHTFLLDNKTQHGIVGYEVYTPFHAHGLRTSLLIDRGFIPMGTSRSTLPTIRDIPGETTLIGMLNLPPAYIALGKIGDTSSLKWPLRVEFVNIATFSALLDSTLFPYVLVMDAKDPRAYSSEWVITTMSPERHNGYAVQWFALALTLLILFVALNRI